MIKYKIKKIQDVLISLDGKKTTPKVFRPASLSPLMSFRSFKRTPAIPKHKVIRDNMKPLKVESEKINQILIVYAGYAIL